MPTNVAVVFRSKSGFTKKYAKWIAEAVNADLYEGQNVSLDTLLKYDTIVYGGGLYAGGINGIKLITSHFDQLKGKNLIVFWLGASPVREKTFEEIKTRSFTPEQQKYMRFFMLRGGFNYRLCTPFDKVLMKLLKAKLKSTKSPDADERGMLESYDHPVDFTNIKYIAPIISAINASSVADTK